MTTLVAIPYFQCADYIEQAVESVLAQTNTDLVCLVVGDGDEPPITVKDSRLHVVTCEQNMGAPFVQQAMLLANPHDRYAPMGADDWLEPNHLASLPTKAGVKAARISKLWLHWSDGRSSLTQGRAFAEIGVFETKVLQSVGGYDITQRCGQDTLLYDDLLPNVTKTVWSSEPTYHRRIRAGSLTQHPDTNFSSAYRKSVIQHNAKVAARCRSLGFKDLKRIRKYRNGLVSQELQNKLDYYVNVLKGELA